MTPPPWANKPTDQQQQHQQPHQQQQQQQQQRQQQQQPVRRTSNPQTVTMSAQGTINNGNIGRFIPDLFRPGK
jgi:hypothetical protein